MYTIEQKKIIKRICRKQAKSFTNIKDSMGYIDSLMKLQEAGLQVSSEDYLREIDETIAQYNMVHKAPSTFMEKLDEENLLLFGLVLKKRYILKQSEYKADAEVIWKKLCLKLIVQSNNN